MSNGNTIQSVVKAMDVLKLVGKSEDGMRLKEIADALGMKTPATHHMVSTLLSGGFLAKYDGAFVIGPELCEMVLNANPDSEFEDAVKREMHRLFNTLPRCVVVMTQIKNYSVELTFRIGYERPNVLQKVSGHTYNIFANAAGLLTLAHANQEMREHLEEKQPFAEMGQHLWGSREKLETFLSEVRTQGYAISPFDAEVSFRAAAPLFDAAGNYRAGLGISIAASQLETKNAKQSAIDELLKAANKIK